ncbi:hypothetical protein DFJ63DRAFT_70228 [Scheffersomyces coipomensis]|uniref:uncharacterized protein n=1 Tax=Scheffersomyces coipomensis TaxID=1788519 RepID=UPI00315DADD3
MSTDNTVANTFNHPSTKTINDSIYELGSSPYPAIALGSSLLFRGITYKPQLKASANTNVYKQVALAMSRPTKKTCFTFGAVNLLGAWLIYDGDEVNGAEFNAVWSSIYLLINGKSSITSLIRGRHVSPLVLSSLALFNTTIYGHYIISSWRGLNNNSRFYD